MRREALLFSSGLLFFVPVGLIYAWLSGGEAVGTTAILLTGGLTGIIGGYLWVTSRRIDARPEDDEAGEIAEGAGELGTYPASSWWPLVVAAGAALCFLALAMGYWIMVPGLIVAVIGLIGWVYQFSRGPFAH